ncbi:hypothetical protein [Mucilaginibacter myungsuensis]|uniref:Uncharacterized protein n=1 Tax=Mucilaginibacter myungsuensis TaxID=649104 RepID=A0A929L0D8_9SPHI|nr:hypothetical protein [Mucilaginibacter myungsuensis]MBE9662189.1 hypothetical protein [Mucilaginibacter myungsuensis]
MLFSVQISFAQKLPQVQVDAMLAPAKIKIDGNTAEWGGKMQAHNRTVDFAYSLANDDEYLYLAVEATQPRVIEKILLVGVQLTVNTTGVKGDTANTVAVSYPNMSYKYVRGILFNSGNKANIAGLPAHAPHPTTLLTRTDSTVDRANKAFGSYAKDIKVIGAKKISDTLISIYNDVQIKAVGRFQNSGKYVYELAFPLKHVGISVAQVRKIAYNIKLNDWGNAFCCLTYVERDPITKARGEERDGDADLNSTTQFWGEYSLARK